jgi:hypothetical protein
VKEKDFQSPHSYPYDAEEKKSNFTHHFPIWKERTKKERNQRKERLNFKDQGFLQVLPFEK